MRGLERLPSPKETLKLSVGCHPRQSVGRWGRITDQEWKPPYPQLDAAASIPLLPGRQELSEVVLLSWAKGHSWEVPAAGQERPLCPQLRACASGNRHSPLLGATPLHLCTLQPHYCFGKLWARGRVCPQRLSAAQPIQARGSAGDSYRLPQPPARFTISGCKE